MSDLVVTIKNGHGKGSGAPPNLSNADPPEFTSYFEGLVGDQWVFQADIDGEWLLRGGDIGWETEVTAANLRDWILEEPERLWLTACLTLLEHRRRLRSLRP